MNAPERPVWFAGDLDDPWVSAIADALPVPVRRLSRTGELPEGLLEGTVLPRVFVLHRAILSPGDAERLARFRAGNGTPHAVRVVLCVGPHIRHADLERWSALVDAVVPEATARETIARHVVELVRSAGPRPAVRVVSRNHELRQTLADSCAALGYAAEPLRDWSESSRDGLALWDVPILEPDWPLLLARQGRTGPVVALLGFADRALVTTAREQGASACLELPCDLADLGFVLDRLASSRAEPPHDVPPPPTARRVRDCRLAGPDRGGYN